MADSIHVIVRKVQDMHAADAPDEQIDEYLKSQGMSVEQFKRNAKMMLRDPRVLNPPSAEPSMAESMQQELASRTGPKGIWDQFWGGAGANVDLAYRTGKKFVSGSTPQDQERIALDRQMQATVPGRVGSAAADVASLYVPLGAVNKAASKLPGLIERLAANVGGSGAVGGLYGGLTSPDDPATGALIGGAGASVGAGLGQLLQGLGRPGVGSAAQRYREEGLPLTVGQSTGGVVRNIEDRLRGWSTNVPIRQAEALQKWHQNTINKTMPPSGQTAVSGAPIVNKVTGTGREAVAEGAQNYDFAYDTAFAKIGPLQADNRLIVGLRNVMNRYGPKMLPSDRDAVMDEIRRIAGEFGNQVGGILHPRAMKELRGSFDGLATTAYREGKGRLGDSYKGIVNVLDDLVRRQSPDGFQALRAVDEKYGDFLRMQSASGKLGASEGVATPHMLRSAIREMDPTAQHRAFARGHTSPEMLKEAKEGIDVLGTTIPPVGPGTAEKLGVGLAATNLATMWPVLATQGLYARPVQKLLTGAYPWQEGIDSAWTAALGNAALRDRNR